MLALAAAGSQAVGFAMTKRFVLELPPRELIGPLFALNALLLVPAAPFVEWEWSARVALLLGLSVLAMAATAVCVFELLVHGTAAAVATSHALSPLPAVALTAVLLPGSVSALQAAAAVLIVGGVLLALGGAFATMTPLRAIATAAVAASGAGALTVLTKLLIEEGLGIVEIYLLRTAAAALLFLALIPPRGVPARVLPRLTVRAGFVTAHFALVIAAVERGSPATVQALVATAPLMLLLGAFVARAERPPPRLAASAIAVLAGVLVILAL